MKRIFNLCLMASLLATLGTACSKKTNSRAKEVIAAENALSAKKAAEDKLKAKEAADKAATDAAAAAAKEEQARRDKAISLTGIFSNKKTEQESNISLYQLLLASQSNGSIIETLVSKNKESSDNDKNIEQEKVTAFSGKETIKICDDLIKRLEKKEDKDLISIDKDGLKRDIEDIVDCMSLNIVSDYIEVGSIRSMCLKVKEVKELELKNEALKKAAEEEAKRKLMIDGYAQDADKAASKSNAKTKSTEKTVNTSSPKDAKELREEANKLISEAVDFFSKANQNEKEYSKLSKTRADRRKNKEELSTLNKEILKLRTEGNAKIVKAEELKDQADELEEKAARTTEQDLERDLEAQDGNK